MAKMSHRVKLKVSEVRGCGLAVLGSFAILAIKSNDMHSYYDETIEKLSLPFIEN